MDIQNVKKYDNAYVEISAFQSSSGCAEYHLMAHVDKAVLTFAEQLQALVHAIASTMAGLNDAHPVFCRLFVSDAANQYDSFKAMRQLMGPCAVSLVEQAPLNGTKLAAWVYLMTGVQPKALSDGLYEVERDGQRHLWMGSWQRGNVGSEAQARHLLTDYADRLREEGATLEANCVRTWFFVENIDNNYAGMVKARNEVFDTEGLTKDTHYIASTGIEGRGADGSTLVLMDAYAVTGLKPGQMKYLYAPTHLNPTYEYGVSFERGTYVDYADRRQVFISGTASIDNHGNVLYVGDIRRQTQRLLENVETLLAEGQCTYDDVSQMIVYLRDVADYAVVKAIYDERFPHKPKVFVHAPVCRPTWLIEMECMAIRKEV